MSMLLACLGLSGFVGAYEMADRMTRRTRHVIRIAVVLIAAGCLASMARLQWAEASDWALLLILLGCGLFRYADRRKGPLDDAGNPVGVGASRTQPPCHCKCSADCGAAPDHAVGGVVSLAPVRKDHLMREAA